jgi:hypothetical protein
MIYFDTPRKVYFRGRNRLSAHLYSDLIPPESTEELLAFAKSIGLRANWIQNSGEWKEHFDLFDGRIPRARKAVAIEVPPRFMISEHLRPRRLKMEEIEKRNKSSD